MSRWIIRGCLGLTDVSCLIVMAFGDSPSFVVGAFLLVVSTFVYTAMLEQVE